MAKVRRSRINWKEVTTDKGLWDWTLKRALVFDARTAGVIGCTAQTVTKARKRYGIAKSPTYQPRKLDMRISHPDLDWESVIPGVWDMDAMVARMPDSALAKMMKCSVDEAQSRREAAGVQPYAE